jgi:hypothetical protein
MLPELFSRWMWTIAASACQPGKARVMGTTLAVEVDLSLVTGCGLDLISVDPMPGLLRWVGSENAH